jgi:hypothetical protein
MSFGGTVTRGGRGAASGASKADSAGLASAARVPGRPGPAGRPQGEAEVDWERVALFGAGVAVGAALGAGVAVLLTPYSGEEIRAAIVGTGARLAHQGRDAWDDLRDELRWAARRGRRRLGRRVQRARWAAEDFLDDRRRPDRWRRKRPAARTQDASARSIDEASVREIADSLC